MKQNAALCAAMFLGACSAVDPQGAEWTLVWNDEFDGTELDATKWAPEVSCWGGGNDERQCYTDRAENIVVSDGTLRLKAARENYTARAFPKGHPGYPGEDITQTYTSGKVRTRGLADWTYGRFEARMKLPVGQGTWPAFWMLPADDHYGPWPLSGEIDILEAVNLGAACDACEGGEGENRSIAALHFGDRWPDNDFHAVKVRLPESDDGYHVFAAEWGAGQINWFVDGRKIYSLGADDWFTAALDKGENGLAPFDRPFYLMFNLAVGGRLSEDNNAKGFDPASFPAELIVDWVRVYNCPADPSTAEACMSR